MRGHLLGDNTLPNPHPVVWAAAAPTCVPVCRSAARARLQRRVRPRAVFCCSLHPVFIMHPAGRLAEMKNWLRLPGRARLARRRGPWFMGGGGKTSSKAPCNLFTNLLLPAWRSSHTEGIDVCRPRNNHWACKIRQACKCLAGGQASRASGGRPHQRQLQPTAGGAQRAPRQASTLAAFQRAAPAREPVPQERRWHSCRTPVGPVARVCDLSVSLECVT